MFADFLFTHLNDSIAQSKFPFLLKLVNTTPVHQKATIEQFLYYEIFQKYVKDLWLRRYLDILNYFHKNFNAVLEEVLMPDSAFCQCFKSANQHLIINKYSAHSLRVSSRHFTVSHMTS